MWQDVTLKGTDAEKKGAKQGLPFFMSSGEEMFINPLVPNAYLIRK